MTLRPKPKESDDAPIKRKRPEALTQREQEILQLIWSGLKNKEIAQRLKISVKTHSGVSNTYLVLSPLSPLSKFAQNYTII
jgi:DNA-binding NarL/FixJ family response regulator